MNSRACTKSKGVRARGQRVAEASKFDSSIQPATAKAARSTQERRASQSNEERQRRSLLLLRERLRGNVAQTAHAVLNYHGIESTSVPPDTVDLANETAEQDIAFDLMGNVTETLRQIETALQRIEDGDYGRCIECDGKIPAARLEAIPYAECCVVCAAKQELPPPDA